MKSYARASGRQGGTRSSSHCTRRERDRDGEVSRSQTDDLPSLVIGQSEPTAQLRPQRPILFDQIPDNLLLSVVEPAGQGGHEKPERRRRQSRRGYITDDASSPRPEAGLNSGTLRGLEQVVLSRHGPGERGGAVGHGRFDTGRHSSAHCHERPPTEHGQIQGTICGIAYLGFVAADSLSGWTVL